MRKSCARSCHISDPKRARDPVMVRRKGELSSAMIDHGWPYQVALEARLSTGDHYFTVHYFCQDLSLCPRGHGFYRDGKHFMSTALPSTGMPSSSVRSSAGKCTMPKRNRYDGGSNGDDAVGRRRRG